MGDAAECQRLSDICVNLTIDFFVVSQCGETKFEQLVVTGLWCDFGQRFDSYNVDGLFDRFADRDITKITTGGITHLRAVFVGIFFILVNGSQGLALFQCSGIGRNNLKGRTWLTGRICSSVHGQTGSLFTAAADDSFDIAGFLIHDRHTGLRLHRKGNPLGKDLGTGLFLKNMGLVLVYIGLSLVIGIKQKLEVFILCILKIQTQHFLTVVLLCAIGFGNSQCPVQTNFGTDREIGRIGIFFVNNTLDYRILRSIDTQTAAVEGIGCLSVSIALLGL